MKENDRKRPLFVTFIGYLFIAAGVFGFAHHVSDLWNQTPPEADVWWVLFLRLLAILGGVFLLRGAGWARWLLLAWMVYHVILGALHSFTDGLVHAILLAVIAYGLLNPATSAFLRDRKQTV